ncbi:hypothetical protein AYL99_06429 [Fonsecaea erecta]|uniref:glutathione transferase n=1 Tax=Fonsecaea erecta TaxID=1367422 RepID=A0A178ZI29_9EURO|nr:hypothetical protein AYL99_06429 [Fonsecaea erecta]OAP59131.1 hypothetical protein AYL99_06429 [Fonsecaea erecta]
MTLKLWTSPLSWNCLRTELVLAEKGIDDVVSIPADLIGGKHKTEDFREKSIFGRVPLLEDGNIVIFESRAIARYLCLKYADVGQGLMPESTDAETKGVWEMWLTLEAIEFDSHVVPVISETLIRPYASPFPYYHVLLPPVGTPPNSVLGKATDEAVVARHKPKLLDCLDVLDKVLSKTAYMGGGEYSLVDIFYMPCMFTVSRCLDIFDGRPHLKKWWETVSAREAWKKTVKPLDDGYTQMIPAWSK